MSIGDNFIGELKFDEARDNFWKFLQRYRGIIGIILLLLLGCGGIFRLRKIYQRNKIRSYNERIFVNLASPNVVMELEKLYYQRGVPAISRKLAGLGLIGEYLRQQHYDKAGIIYGDIFNSEKDIYLKYYSGLNLLVLQLNEEKVNIAKVNALFDQLDNEHNPLRNLVLEQKVMFLLRQQKYKEALVITRKLLDKSTSVEESSFRDRLKMYEVFLRNKGILIKK
jgi:hypothetical protein